MNKVVPILVTALLLSSCGPAPEQVDVPVQYASPVIPIDSPDTIHTLIPTTTQTVLDNLQGFIICPLSISNVPKYKSPGGEEIRELTECTEAIESTEDGVYWKISGGWVIKYRVTVKNKSEKIPNLVTITPKWQSDNSPDLQTHLQNCVGGCDFHPSGCDIKGNISFNSDEKSIMFRVQNITPRQR